MNKAFKYAALAILAAATAALSANAETNLLQAVTINLLYFSQGPTNVDSGVTNYTINGPKRFDTKDLINSLSTNGYTSGDVLVRATPITNVPVYVTNLTAVSTTNLILTNTSTSNTNITYSLIFQGATNQIGDTNLVFGANVEDINGMPVTIGTNTVTIGTNTANPLIIGTNTIVTATTLTNEAGENVGTNYAFVINALSTIESGTNTLGTPTWDIYNPNHNHPVLSPISTNVYFDIHTDKVYGLTNVDAYVHGEQVTRQNVIKFRTTDEIRTLVFSNAMTVLKLQGYAHGHLVAVSLGGGAVGYSQDYSWTGDGSGAITNYPQVMTAGIIEQYFKFLKQ